MKKVKSDYVWMSFYMGFYSIKLTRFFGYLPRCFNPPAKACGTLTMVI